MPRSSEELVRLVERGFDPDFLFFWGHTTRHGRLGKECLSQWYPAAFESDGVRFATAEHYMMWSKAMLFGDHSAAERILSARRPDEAKSLGRRVRGYDDETWEVERFGVVLRGSLAKFRGNPALRSFLLGTDNRVLVEASPRDCVWGIGLSEDDVAARQPHRWIGLNLLGFALMEARSAIREGAQC